MKVVSSVLYAMLVLNQAHLLLMEPLLILEVGLVVFLWTLNEQDGKKVIVYNSNFAKFANVKVPSGKVNITGIFKSFHNQWEIIIRSLEDIKEVAAAEKNNI